eukprot:TRINITY_DN2459_c9_g1_i1.p1 TRINITY_DN2459_c9_g1~~TRINITY_DN2459_c9_g1_i1.p1  ORF type:complete len:355 (+),score=81.03 TRINITY_DN2459_c9_g1_i1:65-1129(+)
MQVVAMPASTPESSTTSVGSVSLASQPRQGEVHSFLCTLPFLNKSTEEQSSSCSASSSDESEFRQTTTRYTHDPYAVSNGSSAALSQTRQPSPVPSSASSQVGNLDSSFTSLQISPTLPAQRVAPVLPVPQQQVLQPVPQTIATQIAPVPATPVMDQQQQQQQQPLMQPQLPIQLLQPHQLQQITSPVQQIQAIQPPQPQHQTVVVSVHFKYGRMSEFLNSTGFLQPGAHVIVAGDRGEDLGVVVSCRYPTASDSGKKLASITRLATITEVNYWNGKLTEDEKDAVRIVQEVLNRHGVNLEIVNAEFQFDRKKLTFYFQSSDNETARFKPVLGELYSIWKCRIWFTKSVRTQYC